VLLGLLGVASALNVGIAVATGLIALLFVWPRSWPTVAIPLRLLGMILIAFLALVGFDVLLNFLLKLLHHIHRIHELRVPIPFGLFLAVAVFAAAAYWYLLHSGCRKHGAAGATALVLALLVIIVTPYVIGKVNADTTPVPPSKSVPSKLDMLIVTDGRHHRTPEELPPTPALGEFKVSYSVGVARGDGVRWTLVDGSSEHEALVAAAEGGRRVTAGSKPLPTEEADSVLLLLVDGTAPVSAAPAELPDRPQRKGEVARWTRITAAATGAGEIPTFALLQSTDQARLARWKRWSSGTAVSVQALESQAITDAAFRLAVAAPTSQADFLLAMKYRPVLLFDRDEQVPWPLSIGALFKEGRVRLCHNQGLQTECPDEPTLNPGELESGSTSLRLDLRDSDELRALARRELANEEAGVATGAGQTVARAVSKTVPESTPPAGTMEPAVKAGAVAAGQAPPGAGSTIYVHPVSIGSGRRERLYLDYWWYLPENPVELGGGALCGAGLVISGITCDNHQSDWEGMTVVVDRAGVEPQIVAVQYAQHDSVIRYGWSLLRKRWDSSRPVQNLVAQVADSSTRPLAFVARGTHATYPLPCGGCGLARRPELAEEPHRGDLRWAGDDTSACGRASCLQLLPTHDGGKEPALWNAYDQPWGELDCFFVYYCDSGPPPKSPGRQRRYQEPARYDGVVDSHWQYQPLQSKG
jgi:hypothetical protein